MTSEPVVLVVEDEEESRETLRELLEFEGHRVQVAINGKEALDLLESMGAPPCIVLLDLLMPVMDGWKFLDRLRASGRLATTKVVIMTSAPHRAPAGLPILEKPLDVDKVMGLVDACC
ncbi:MAG TPA: response regulator [Myxococcaceae bacterium]